MDGGGLPGMQPTPEAPPSATCLRNAQQENRSLEVMWIICDDITTQAGLEKNI